MSLCPLHVKRALLQELHSQEFSACLELTALLLSRMGYENVFVSTRSDFIGRHKDGGSDLIAFKSVSGGKRKVVVQLKRYPVERPIFRRTLDELRGVALRAGAAEGLLITTSSFSPSVPAAEYASATLAPLRLIDGEQLVNLMTLARVGVLKLPASAVGDGYQINTAYFHQLARDHKPKRPIVRRVRVSGTILVSSRVRLAKRA